jgi:N-acetylneuraminic acid mutarotase
MMKSRIGWRKAFAAFVVVVVLAAGPAEAQIGDWTDVAGPGTATAWPVSAWSEGIISFCGGIDAAGTGIVPELQVYDVGAGEWMQNVPPPPQPVFAGIGAFWQGRLVVVGGFDSLDRTATAAVQIFDTGSGAWTQGAPMPSPRGGMAGGMIDGVIYVVGGSSDGTFPTDNPTYAYDIAADSWSTLDACPFFQVPGEGERGAFLGGYAVLGGKLYVGGHAGGAREFFRFDPQQPAGSQWTRLADVPEGAGVQSPGALGVPELNMVLWFGGGDASGTALDVTYRYDVGSDTWSDLANPLTTAVVGPGVGLSGGFLWSHGGAVQGAAVDPAPFMRAAAALDSVFIDPHRAYQVGPPGAQMSFDFTVTNYASGEDDFTVAVSGASWTTTAPGTTGTLAPGESTVLSVTVEIPDTAVPYVDQDQATITVTGVGHPDWTDAAELTTYSGLGAWESLPPMPAPRAFAAAAYGGGYVWVFGGTDDPAGEHPTATVFRYDPAAGSWSTHGTSLPTPLSHSAAVLYWGTIYLLGGQTDSGVTTDVYAFELESGTFRVIPDSAGLPPSVEHRAARTPDAIYRLGGRDPATGAPLADVWIFDPADETWTEGPPMSQPRYAFVAGGSRGIVFACGGIVDAAGQSDTQLSEQLSEGSWSAIEPMIDTWSRAACGVWGQYLLAAGGRRNGRSDRNDESTILDTVGLGWIASPQTPPLAEGRLDAAGAAGDGYFYVFGGRNAAGDQVLARAERLAVIVDNPTPTVIPPSPTPVPTFPPPSPTPPAASPTATADPGEFGVELEIPDDYVSPGETFWCRAEVHNPGAAYDQAPFFALLDLGIGEYWFFPSWAHYPPDIDFQPTDLPAGSITEIWVLPEFQWPDTGSSTFGPIFIHSAVLTPDMKEIQGRIDSVQFSYGP